MWLPRLYKYLNVEGAKLTLRNRNFRHAKPSDFNDVKDMTIESLFPESEEAALSTIIENFYRILLRNIDKPPTSTNVGMRKTTAQLQMVLKNTPVSKLMNLVLRKQSVSEIYDLNHLREYTKGFIAEINEFMQSYRVLCVSEKNNSFIMWKIYAQNHQGIVLRILPNLKKDSKYSLFRKVEYRAKRPTMYDDAISFLENSLFGDQVGDRKKSLDRIIYTKTLDWEYEQEQRLVIPVNNGQDWNTMPYHPEEIAELYLGAKMNDSIKSEIIDLAMALNPDIGIFQSVIDIDSRILLQIQQVNLG
jgi:hypothetical protein